MSPVSFLQRAVHSIVHAQWLNLYIRHVLLGLTLGLIMLGTGLFECR